VQDSRRQHVVPYTERVRAEACRNIELTFYDLLDQLHTVAHANSTEHGGGVVTLNSCNIEVTGDDGYGIATQSGDSVSPIPDPITTISATNTTITMTGDRDVCALSFGGTVLLTNCVATLNGNNGWGIEAVDYFLRGSTVTAKDTMLTVTGNGNEFVSAYYGGVPIHIRRLILSLQPLMSSIQR
jgi:hypothetical protein